MSIIIDEESYKEVGEIGNLIDWLFLTASFDDA